METGNFTVNFTSNRTTWPGLSFCSYLTASHKSDCSWLLDSHLITTEHTILKHSIHFAFSPYISDSTRDYTRIHILLVLSSSPCAPTIACVLSLLFRLAYFRKYTAYLSLESYPFLFSFIIWKQSLLLKQLTQMIFEHSILRKSFWSRGRRATVYLTWARWFILWSTFLEPTSPLALWLLLSISYRANSTVYSVARGNSP